MMKIASVVGARPNFIKLAPIHKAISTISNHIIIHTGQHYDYKLSEIFFKEFDLPKPNFHLDVGSGTHGFQIGEMIKRLEKIFLDYGTDFDLVLVYGDTNSTFAGALAAKGLGINVAHIESGLRSFDRRMPEEINRILTDQISDYLFAPTQAAINNLEREHVFGKVIYTGDIAVEIVKDAILLSSLKSSVLNDLALKPKSYILFTMHRAENTNSEVSLTSVIRAFEILSEQEMKQKDEEMIIIVFPIHPRTAHLLKNKNLYGRLKRCKNVKLIEPVGYIDFIMLIQNATKVITDSGGVQKEAYLLAIPCITIRKSTEWIETVEEGWNILTDTDTNKIVKAAIESKPKTPIADQIRPIFGEGRTSVIIKNTIESLCVKSQT
jgi:UDP-N-acetylglucosamine 2-epimerase (non-hydrolysing)